MGDAAMIERFVNNVGFSSALMLFALYVFYRHGLPMGRDLVNAHKEYLSSTSKRIDSIDDKVDGLHSKFDRFQCKGESHAGL